MPDELSGARYGRVSRDQVKREKFRARIEARQETIQRLDADARREDVLLSGALKEEWDVEPPEEEEEEGLRL